VWVCYVWVGEMCVCGFCNVWACVCMDFVMCECVCMCGVCNVWACE